MSVIQIEVQLSEDDAGAFAEFLKRTQPADYRVRAGSDLEARRMYNAGLRIQSALGQKSSAPR